MPQTMAHAAPPPSAMRRKACTSSTAYFSATTSSRWHKSTTRSTGMMSSRRWYRTTGKPAAPAMRARPSDTPPRRGRADDGHDHGSRHPQTAGDARHLQGPAVTRSDAGHHHRPAVGAVDKGAGDALELLQGGVVYKARAAHGHQEAGAAVDEVLHVAAHAGQVDGAVGPTGGDGHDEDVAAVGCGQLSGAQGGSPWCRFGASSAFTGGRTIRTGLCLFSASGFPARSPCSGCSGRRSPRGAG